MGVGAHRDAPSALRRGRTSKRRGTRREAYGRAPPQALLLAVMLVIAALLLLTLLPDDLVAEQLMAKPRGIKHIIYPLL